MAILPSNKRIAIFGAGAVGCYYGGMMLLAGYEVTFVARGRHGAALAEKGLVMHSFRHGDHTLYPQVVTELTGEYDFVFLSVKSHDTRHALGQILPHLSEHGCVVSFQNGVENIDTIAEVAGAERTVGASLFIGATITAPGVLSHTAGGNITYGVISESAKTHLTFLAKLFYDAGLKAEETDDIRMVQWKKLLWNIAFNPLSALLDATCGKMVKDPKILDMMHLMVEEGVQAARAAGIVIPEEYWKNVTSMTANLDDYKTSMLIDVQNQRKPEIDGILGPVVRIAQQHRFHVPYCDAVMRAVQFRFGGWFLYPPRSAADVLVADGRRVLLIERKNPPYGWAIPGGFIDYGEKVEDAATRELREETGIAVPVSALELLGVYSDPARDKRGHVISTVYVTFGSHVATAADDALNARYFDLDELPELAFDHAVIIADFRKKYAL